MCEVSFALTPERKAIPKKCLNHCEIALILQMKKVKFKVHFSSVQFSHSVVSNSLQPHELQHVRPPCPSPTPESTQTHVHLVDDAIQPSHPLSSPSPPALNLFSIRVFSNESALRIRWPKYWSFSFNISPFDEHPGLISFRMNWLDLLAVRGTLKSLLQHHSSKASIQKQTIVQMIIVL